MVKTDINNHRLADCNESVIFRCSNYESRRQLEVLFVLVSVILGEGNSRNRTNIAQWHEFDTNTFSLSSHVFAIPANEVP